MPTVEVRCCCDPERLLGHAEVLVWPEWEGTKQPFTLPDGSEAVLTWGILKYGTGHRFGALKSDGIPIETLRTIPEFKERSE